MNRRCSSNTSTACRRALSTINSVRVIPSSAAASSTIWSALVSIRRLMLRLASDCELLAAPETGVEQEELEEARRGLAIIAISTDVFTTPMRKSDIVVDL